MSQLEDDLPHGWVMTDVASVGEVRLGRQRSPSKHTGEFTTKYIRAANITPDGLNLVDVLEMDFTPDEREIYKLHEGDVLLTEASGTSSQVGRAVIWRAQIPDCCYQNTVIRFRPRAVTAEYALTVFRHYATSGVLSRTARGVGIQHLGAKRFAALPFPLPPLEEQRRIAETVDHRLAELRLARNDLHSALQLTQHQTAEILAAAVAGELVESEHKIATREGRSLEDGRSLLERVRQNTVDQTEKLRSSGFEVPLGAPSLPIGWALARVDDVGQVMLGKQREPRSHQGLYMRPYLRVANVHEDRIDVSDVMEMNFTPDEYEVYQLRDADILLNEGQSPELVGRPAIYRGEVPGACFQKTLIRFRANDAIEPEYALIVFRHLLHSGVFRSTARWTTNIAHLSRERFAAIIIPIPPINEQRRIALEATRRLATSRSQESDIRAALVRLPALEAEILSAAVSGALVPQDPQAEPAATLLSRLSAVQAEQIRSPSRSSRQKSDAAMLPARRRQGGPANLTEVVREAGRSLSVSELFVRAGYDPNSSEHVEHFYVALRSELGRSLRQANEALENATLEVIGDATD